MPVRPAGGNINKGYVIMTGRPEGRRPGVRRKNPNHEEICLKSVMINNELIESVNCTVKQQL